MNTEHAQIVLALAIVSFNLSSLIIKRVTSFNVVLKDRTLFNTLLLLCSIE